MSNRLTDKFGLENYSSIDGSQLDIRPDEYKAFAIDDQVRPNNALIDFWLANGDQTAIAYNHLYDLQWKRSEGLLLTFSDHLVTLRGHGFDVLYRGLKRHRIIYIWEASKQEALTANEKSPVVTEIFIERKPTPFDIHQS